MFSISVLSILPQLFLLNICITYIVASHILVFREWTTERTCVYLNKIENSSYHQELVSHPMSENVDELSSLVIIKLLQTAINHAGHVRINRFHTVCLRIHSVFFIDDQFRIKHIHSNISLTYPPENERTEKNICTRTNFFFNKDKNNWIDLSKKWKETRLFHLYHNH